jgi:arylsulfatase A-like enzyme
VNVLLITLDQFRADCLSVAGHPLVRTPNLDQLANEGVRLNKHYSQAAPCGPGRACLYTGMYQMNNRVVANGTPLDARFDNVAHAARRLGYSPALFGYTDQSVDPREVTGPDDPRLQHYSGVLPGFDAVLDIPDDHEPWMQWLRDLGYTGLGTAYRELANEPKRPVEHSVSSFLTNHAIEWIGQQSSPWFAHLSYLRPHPPYAAAGEFSTMYSPDEVTMPIEPAEVRHVMHDFVMQLEVTAAPKDPARMRELRAQYYGMISEVDAQLGRVWATLRELGVWDDTLIIVTADHGEQLGDHGLIQKVGYFEESYHIVGIVRDPAHPETHGTVVNEFTENVDLFPTICDAIGAPIPAQCDGLPLTPLLEGNTPTWWRDSAHWEFDWRDIYITSGPDPQPWDRRLERQNLAVHRDESTLYVQFGDGSWLCFDMANDPTARTQITDPAVVLAKAQAMLTWRSQHADRTLTGAIIDKGGRGRMPVGVPDGVGSQSQG